MIGNIGVGGFVLIFAIALLFFGPSKLPQLGRAIGSTLSEFRKGTKELIEDERTTTMIEEDKK